MDAPHQPLPEYYREERERAGWVRDLFTRTAGDYDRIERLMGLGSGSWYRRRALTESGLLPGMRIVDVGMGTGLVTREAVTIVGNATHVTGVDPSPGMLAASRVPAGVRVLQGSAEEMPVADAHADFLSMGYALRHIGRLSAAFNEFHRVLKPGGRVCLLEITAPRGRMSRALLRAYMRGLVPALAKAFGRHRDMPQLMRYYWDTIEACAPPEKIMATLQEAGFVDVRRVVSLGIFSEYRARKPS